MINVFESVGAELVPAHNTPRLLRKHPPQEGIFWATTRVAPTIIKKVIQYHSLK
jgi:hypothetical protein